MGSRTWRVVVLAALAGAAPAVGGCLYAAAGAAAVGTYAYVKGDLERTVQHTTREVVDATEKAFHAMDLVLISKNASGVDGEVIGKTADNTNVRVKVDSVGENASKISIRFGTFGDEAKSRALMEEIEKGLS